MNTYFGVGAVFILCMVSLLPPRGLTHVSDSLEGDVQEDDLEPDSLHVADSEITCTDDPLCVSKPGAVVGGGGTTDATGDHSETIDNDPVDIERVSGGEEEEGWSVREEEGEGVRVVVVTEQPNSFIDPPTVPPPATPPTSETTHPIIEETFDPTVEEAMPTHQPIVDEVIQAKVETTPHLDEAKETTHPDQGEEEATPSVEEEGEEATPTDEKEEEEEGADDVPTFTEFSQRKRMEQDSSQKPPPGDKPVVASSGSNNYASLDCGAKIVNSNPQAQNPSAILSENRDVYMINPCSVDIWFVVELCELVELHSLQIACFELFSSIPKSFNVSVSERFPSDEWRFLGTMIASNEREIQSFPLAVDESNYAKYIRVEMVSHYGSEHFCPLSLLRVIGASMMEVYEYSESQQEMQVEPVSPTVAPYEGEGIEDDLFGGGLEESLSQETVDSDRATSLPRMVAGAVLSLLETVNGYISQQQQEDQSEHAPLEDHQSTSEDTVGSESVWTDPHPASPDVHDGEGEVESSDGMVTEGLHGTGTSEPGTPHSELPAESPVHSKDISHSETFVPSTVQYSATEAKLTTNDHTLPTPTPSVVDQASEVDVAVVDHHLRATVAESDVEANEDGVGHRVVEKTDCYADSESVSDSETSSEDESGEMAQEVAYSSSPVPSGGGGGGDLLDGGLAVDELELSEIVSVEGLGSEDSLMEREGEGVEGDDQLDSGDGHGAVADDGDWLVVVKTDEVPETIVAVRGDHSGPQDDHGGPIDDHSSPENVTGDGNGGNTEEVAAREGGDLSDDLRDETNSSVSGEGGGGEGGEVGEGVRNSTEEPHPPDSQDEGLTNGNGAGVLSGQQKEKSVFLRLSNRIRDLEENMSLFSSYLDEISTGMKRNKNRTEDGQRALEKKVNLLNDTLQLVTNQTGLAVVVLAGLYEDMQEVTEALAIMTDELRHTRREAWLQGIMVIVLLLALVGLIAVAFIVWLLCNMTRSHENSPSQRAAVHHHSHMTGSGTGSDQLPTVNGISKSFHITHQNGLLGATADQQSTSETLLHTEPWSRVARRKKRKPDTNHTHRAPPTQIHNQVF